MDFGIFFFLLIAGMAFWLLIFLFTVAVPYWITQSLLFKYGKMKELPRKNMPAAPTEVKAE
jgi:hypothetical protein